MTKRQLNADEVLQVTRETLATIGATEDEFEQMRSAPLKNSPVWPGPDYQPQTPSELAAFIDHTLLAPEATFAQVDQLCRDAIEYQFATVCVNSCHVERCVQALRDTPVKVGTVVGFPLGAAATEAKGAEARYAAEAGAGEVDMVLNIGSVRSGSDGWLAALRDITAVRQNAWDCTLKVILETALLSSEEIVTGCVLSVMGGADFVKTSTGFSKGGATVEDVKLMRAVVGAGPGVKASGGVRDAVAALAMIRAGANRIGTSSGSGIVRGEGAASRY